MGVYWGWVVCGAFLTLVTLYNGTVFSFSEMIIPLSNNSNSTMSTLTGLGSLPVSLPMLLAPIATWLHYRVQARHLVITGVIMTSLALMVMPLIDDIATMLAVFAVVGGLGILLMAHAPFYLIGSYFPYEHPRHVLASSIVACGFPLATLIFNPLTYALIGLTGWRWTYGFYAILMFIGGLSCAITFRPNTVQELEEELNKTSQITQQETIDKKSPLSSKYYVTEKGDANRPISSEKSETQMDSHYDKIDLEQGTWENISECESYSKYEKAELENNLQQNETTHESLKFDNKELGWSTVALMGTLWLLATLCTCMAFTTPLLILVKQMELMKISHSSASRVMSLIGLCQFISRLVTAFLGDFIKGRILYMSAIFALLMCAQNALVTLANTYIHIVLYAIATGVCGGPMMAAIYPACSEVLCGAYVPELFSVYRVSIGIGSLFGPTVAGVIYDATGSFIGIFYVISAAYAFASLFYCLIPLIHRTKPGCMLFYRRQKVSSCGYSSMSSSSGNGSEEIDLLTEEAEELSELLNTPTKSSDFRDS